MSEGFLGRWAKRKEAARKGQALPEPEQSSAEASPPPPREGGSSEALAGHPPPLGEGSGGGAPASEPTPTLDDVHALAPGADVSRFVRPEVAPEVKNAALKKLFADPHFNRMDGLDVYIDDYNKPDPLPPAMLRKLAGARFLNLFDEDGTQQADTAGAPPREVAGHDAAETVAQSDTRTGDASPPADDHADPDLRLQQDDAPGPAGPGAGPR